ncbi:hypothetical protein CBR_g11156 [Chara braunii]|uniref:Myb/SANT-like DNA-binding domain-containing protein n=1 Tax=Chara braunii TaxID=69332 RepID=A0A388KQ94_CHABU|nr:hypothetical protein CBR_g11156 [Chara braunii]|eukprot:GBG72224.1 hypothetical protein CBR_g11156 [Chara braunii]
MAGLDGGASASGLGCGSGGGAEVGGGRRRRTEVGGDGIGKRVGKGKRIWMGKRIGIGKQNAETGLGSGLGLGSGSRLGSGSGLGSRIGIEKRIGKPDRDWEAEAEGGGGRRRRAEGPPGEKAWKHPSWSIEEMMKLARAKRDQQAHFEGMPHNYGRMRNREWKLQDFQKRLLEVGVDKTTDDIGKKWDNLFQQYKKVQHYQNASGGKKFFNLTPALRTEEGFNFIMEDHVYDEIDAMSKGNKTIYPDNVADTSAREGLQMPRSPSVAGESAAGGDGNDDDGGWARESGFTVGSTGRNCKRKNMRQQTFEVIAEVMDKHGALMATPWKGPASDSVPFWSDGATFSRVRLMPSGGTTRRLTRLTG